jgi:hypothetical protein
LRERKRAEKREAERLKHQEEGVECKRDFFPKEKDDDKNINTGSRDPVSLRAWVNEILQLHPTLALLSISVLKFKSDSPPITELNF